MKFQFSAGLILFYKKNKTRLYLVLHYPHGHWDFAKGAIEKGESKEAAALRELKEETGISATIIDGFEEKFTYFFRHDDLLIKKTVYFFIAQADDTAVSLSDEHIDSAWLSFEDAMERLTFDNAKETLKLAHDFLG